MTSPTQISGEAAGLDYSAEAARVSDSWSGGWRSALLREYESRASVENLQLPGVPDQLLVLVLSGVKEIESFDGSRWSRATHKPGRMAMTAPGNSTRLRWRVHGSGPQRSVHLHLPGNAMRAAVQQVWETDADRFDFPDALDAGDTVARQVMLAMRDAHRRGLPDLYAEAAVAFLAVHLVSTYCTVKPAPARSLTDLNVDRAKQFMMTNIGRQVTLADIAGSVNLSVFHFSRSFKTATGWSPRRWLTHQRLEFARRRLQSGSDPVEAIALECGYASLRQFSSSFTRHLGMTPNEFRRQHRSGGPGIG